METAYFERFGKPIQLDGKDLFMADNAGNPQYVRQFPVLFDSNSELDHARMHLEHSGSIHGQYVRSYWENGYYQDLSYL
jgi:hypothetical protein